MKKRDYTKKLSFRTRLSSERLRAAGKVVRKTGTVKRARSKYEHTSFDGRYYKIVKSSIKGLIGVIFKIVARDPKKDKFVVKLIRAKFRGKTQFLMSNADVFQHSTPWHPKEEAEEMREKTSKLPAAPKPTAAQKKFRRKTTAEIDQFSPLPVYKVIKSILPPKSSYTVLHYFQIENKTAIATDLDVYYVKKDPLLAGLADGMYMLADKNFIKTEMDPGEYPEVPNTGAKKFKEKIGTVNRRALLTELAKASEYMSSEIHRRPMTGILLHAVNDHYGRVIATDGATLYVGELDLQGFVPGEYILNTPYKLIDALRSFDDNEIEITTAKDPKVEFPAIVSFNARDGFLVVRLIEGPYPNYDAVWTKYNTQIIVSRDALEQVLKDWRPYVREFQSHLHRIAVQFEKDRMIVLTQATINEEASFPRKGFVRIELPIENKEIFYQPHVGSLTMPLRIDSDGDPEDNGYWWWNYDNIVKILKTYKGEKLYVGFDWNGFTPGLSRQKSTHWSDKDLSTVFPIEKYEHQAPAKNEKQIEFEKMSAEKKTYIVKNYSDVEPEVAYAVIKPGAADLTPEVVVQHLTYKFGSGDIDGKTKIFTGSNAGSDAMDYIKDKYRGTPNWEDEIDTRPESWLPILKEQYELNADTNLDVRAEAMTETQAPEGEPAFEEPGESAAPFDFGYQANTGLTFENDRVRRVPLPEGYDLLSPALEWLHANNSYQYTIAPGVLMYNPIQGIIFKYLGLSEQLDEMNKANDFLARVETYANEDGSLVETPTEEHYIFKTITHWIPVRKEEPNYPEI